MKPSDTERVRRCPSKIGTTNYKDYKSPAEIKVIAAQLGVESYSWRTETHLVKNLLDAERELKNFAALLEGLYIEALKKGYGG